MAMSGEDFADRVKAQRRTLTGAAPPCSPSSTAVPTASSIRAFFAEFAHAIRTHVWGHIGTVGRLLLLLRVKDDGRVVIGTHSHLTSMTLLAKVPYKVLVAEMRKVLGSLCDSMAIFVDEDDTVLFQLWLGDFDHPYARHSHPPGLRAPFARVFAVAVAEDDQPSKRRMLRTLSAGESRGLPFVP